MKERLFYLWRVANIMASVSFFVVYLNTVVTNVIEKGALAWIIMPKRIVENIGNLEFDNSFMVLFCLFIFSWLIGWIITGRHPWFVGFSIEDTEG